ncbi:MAG: cytochrome c oxidase subunit, partial [Solirubrobacteraceae bacterium]|nr:cytochrome c oxidase subunit [Solirubrobacteraceae bacterium]
MSAKLRAPGWYRAALYLLLGVAFSYAITIGARALLGYDPLLDGEAVLTVALLSCPFFFWIGLGAFDYWFHWAAGRPTVPEDHSGHGARSWRDYFRV